MKNTERDIYQLFKAIATGLSIKMSGYAKEYFGYKRVSRNAQKRFKESWTYSSIFVQRKSL